MRALSSKNTLSKIVLRNQIDKIRLLFHRDRESYLCFYRILGFYPRNIQLYEQALLHKSSSVRSDKGRPLNNERLEFLGDAILDAIVGDIVYKRFEGKREGFLTNTRSKIVQRETLNKLAVEIGLDKLIKYSTRSSPVFQTEVRIEGLPAGTGTGYSKKESQQNAAQMAIKKVKDPIFMATVNETKMQQSAMAAEPEPEMDADSDIELLNDNILEENEFDNEITAEPIVKSIQSKSPCDVPESPDRDLH